MTQAAMDAGHEPEIEHVGRKFRVICSCGWKSHLDWPRKKTFWEISQHIAGVGSEHISVKKWAGITTSNSGRV